MRVEAERVGMNAGRLKRIGPCMQAYVDRGIYAGVATLIARRGQIVHEACSAGATRKPGCRWRRTRSSASIR